MGLFTIGLLTRALLEAQRHEATLSAQAAERAQIYGRMERRQSLAASRTRWLENHGAERSFPCGVVRPAHEGADDEGLRMLQGMDLELPVTAAILADDVAFLAEPPETSGVGEVIEIGRLARASVMVTDVVDAAGGHVPEPSREGFDADADVWLVLRWGSGAEADEERFLFRSAWLAWDAARRLRVSFSLTS